jgi:hypothetical protein
MTTERTSEIFSADQVSMCRSCSRALRGPRTPRWLAPPLFDVVGVGVAAGGWPAACCGGVLVVGGGGEVHGWLGALVRVPGEVLVPVLAAAPPLDGIAEVGGLEDFGPYPLEV